MIYRINSNQSQIHWKGADSQNENEGDIKVKHGTIVEELNSLVGGQLAVDLTSLHADDAQLSDEDEEKLTRHLKSKTFLNVDKYPEVNFTLKEIVKHKNYLDLKGVVQLKGYAFGFSVPAEVNKKGKKLNLKGHFTLEDINPELHKFIGENYGDETPHIEIDYNIIAEPAED